MGTAKNSQEQLRQPFRSAQRRGLLTLAAQSNKAGGKQAEAARLQAEG